jgi:DNA primase
MISRLNSKGGFFNGMDEVSIIREKTDLVSLIGEYIPLKKAGRNFKSTCPFHSEKTPSFVVSPERQIWHCFGGCDKGGDVYTFLMEYENMEFVEALRMLAKKTGIELQSDFQKGASSKKENIYRLNRLALDFYHYVLTKHKAGKKAFSYLTEKRNLDTRLIETFSLGFSPKAESALSSYLTNKKKYKKEDLIEAGLSFSGRNGLVDFFRNRIMFPLFDHRGNIVGFSGRTIDDAPADAGKYINTRDTIAYHKGSQFFGLNTAKEAIKKYDKAIIVEGELDVISCFSIDIKNVIAVKGTALTEGQVSLVSRFTNNICLCFDKDEAGFQATKRSLTALEKKGVNVTTCILDSAKDADEQVRKNPLAFKKAIKKDTPIYDYIFSKTFSSFDKNSIDGKRRISAEILPVLLRIENAIVKEHYLRRLSNEIDVSLDALVQEMERIEKKEIVKEDVVSKIGSKNGKKSREQILEDYLLSLIVQNKDAGNILKKCLDTLKDYEFRTISYRKIIDYLLEYFKKQKSFDSKYFLKTLPEELVVSFDKVFLLPLPRLEPEQYEKEAEKSAKELRAVFLRNKIKDLSVGLKEEDSEILQKIADLENELSMHLSPSYRS